MRGVNQKAEENPDRNALRKADIQDTLQKMQKRSKGRK